ncbi:MAG: hypothetical protein LQ350_008259 [Teloschistes chrysophthalmus]|nr:MAG: hypothetical protein LQ350_008259 [Niorma chrysophthalma]
MVFVDMDSLQFYKPPVQPVVLSNGRSTASNLRIPLSRWEEEDFMAVGASQQLSGVPYNPDMTHSQYGTCPFQKDSLDSFRAQEMGHNSTKGNEEIASMAGEHAVTGWDDMIPLSCQKASNPPHRPGFRQPPGIICKTGVLGKPTARETICDSWLDIDHFFHSDLEAEDGAVKDKCQETGDIEGKPGPAGAKDGQVGDGSRGAKHGGEDVIAYPEMEGFEVDVKRFHNKDGHRAGISVDAEGEQNPSDAQALQALMASSPRVACRGRGKPRYSRPKVVVGNTTWEVTKVAGHEQSGEEQLFKVQAEAWLAEKETSSLRDAIATYQSKQGCTRKKRKSICGAQRRTLRRRKE